MTLTLTKKTDLKDHYVIASNKIYTIGAQDGTFPSLGFHVEGQMGGVFTQPIKLLDGYRISLLKGGNKITLTSATTFTLGENETTFSYDVEGIQLIRKEMPYYNRRMMEVSLQVEGCEQVTVEVAFDVHLVGCWTKEMIGKGNEISKVSTQTEAGAIFKNTEENWFAGIFAINGGKNLHTVERDGTASPTITFRITLTKESPIRFLILSSTVEEAEVLEAVEGFQVNRNQWLEETKAHTKKVLETTKLTTNEETFDTAFSWLKLNYLMLTQNIEGIGEGFTAGYPDYPWFFGCDTAFGVKGTFAVGQQETSINTLRILKNISEEANQGNGRIIHELSPFGIVYNPGNTQETPQYVTTIWEAFLWTGDRAFLEEMYPICKKGMEWIEKENSDGKSLFPLGSGVTEVEGLNTRLLDTAVLTYAAYRDLGKMATLLGDEEAATRYSTLGDQLKEDIITYYYIEEEHLFADVVCTKEEIADRKEEIINSCKNTPSQVAYLRGYLEGLLETPSDKELIPVLMKNWIIISPLLEGMLPIAEGQAMLKTILETGFLNEYGMMLSGMPVAEGENHDDLYAMNLAMSMNTGALIKALAKYDMVDEAWKLMQQLVATLGVGMPGTISEVLPDKGCFMQFWSGYGIHHAFVQDILGITVDAYNKTIFISPNLPKALDAITLDNFKVGDTVFCITYKKVEERTVVEAIGQDKTWTIHINK